MSENYCAICPPNSEWPYFHRVIQRMSYTYLTIFIFLAKRKIGKSITIALVLAFIPVLIFSVLLEAIKPFFTNGVHNMKTTITAIFAILSILCSYGIIWSDPTQLTPLADLLLNILIALFSLFLGFSLNEARIKKSATDRWMPAAESACKELITILATVERLQNGQGAICEHIEKYLPIPPEGYPSLKMVIENKCKACTDSLTNIKTLVNKGIKDWEVFLGSNCEKGECKEIQYRLDEFMKSCLQ